VAENLECGMKEQTADVLRQIDALLAACGTNKSRILSATVYVRDMKLKPGMDEAWLAWVDQAHPPARATVQAELGSPDTLVEIMCTAAKGA
jgi:enamine deaminase RidA (YjgF/YER057c/UK114 family)